MEKLIVKNPGCGPIVQEVEKIDLDLLQSKVKGNIASPLIPTLAETGVTLFANDEGLLARMSPNVTYSIAGHNELIVGPVVFVGTDGEGETVGLTDVQVEVVRTFIEWSDNNIMTTLGSDSYRYLGGFYGA